MFNSNRYATRGIIDKVRWDVQLMLWSLIDQRKAKSIEVDYLQVFELSIMHKEGIAIQKITHKQECPPAIDSYYAPLVETPVQMTVWVMDCDEYCMMLLPDEY